MADNEKRSAEDVARWLIAQISQLIGIPAEELRADEPIVNYLSDSRDALSLAADLEGWLGVELSASIVWDHPTIAALADHVAEEVRKGREAAALPG
jgi:acyl carrier protein